MGRPVLIRPNDVPYVFDDACLKELAELTRLPSSADMRIFGAGVRWAVRGFLNETNQPTPNRLHREIAALHRATMRAEYEKLAVLIECISPAARHWLEGRRATIGELMPDWRIPDAEELRDPARRANAASGLRRLIQVGGTYRHRMRPSGRPTVSVVPLMHAPAPSRAEPRREAERSLVMLLQFVVAEAGGQVPLTARVADAGRKAGPFVRMAERVLLLTGAWNSAGAEGRVVRLINDLHLRWKQWHQRPRFGAGTLSR
jgi:hypothetical protein